MTSASDFQRLHNGIRNNLTKIGNNAQDLEDLVKKIGTPEDSEPLRARYHRLQNETKVLVQHTNDSLQQLKNTPVQTDAEQRQKTQLAGSLPKQYLETLNRFQEAQRNGARKEKESLDRARANSYRQQGMSDSPFVDNFVSLSGTSGQYQQQQQAVLAIEQNNTIQDIQRRDEDLRRLEGDIVQVNEIFKDVAKLVHDQGGMIDSIDHHIIDTETRVVSANQNLTKAVDYQSSARRKKFILIAVAILVLIIIVLVLIFTLRNK